MGETEMMTAKQRKARTEPNFRHEVYMLAHCDQYHGAYLGDAPVPEMPKAPAIRKSAGQRMDMKPPDDCTRKPSSSFK